MSTTPVRRIVTGHDARGRAIVTADTRIEGRLNPSKVSTSTTVWATSGWPVDIDSAEDRSGQVPGLTLPGGSVLRVVDMLPGGCSPLHRTSSLDYGVVLSGQAELILDNGAAVLLEPGDIVVQRGSIHAWRNPSADKIARIVFVLLDATPATVDGAPLPDIHPSAGLKP